MIRRGTLAVAGLVVVAMGALLVASFSGPVELLNRPRATSASPPVPQVAPPVTLTARPAPTTDEGVPTGWDPSGITNVILQFVIALLVLAVIFGAAVLLQAVARRRPHLETLETSAPPPVPDELLRSAESRMALLETGEPRNAIVAAWLDLEAAAAGSGLPRHPAETSTEYTTRVIATWQVDRDRLDDLAQLYREARFSQHSLGETERRRALDDLRVLHDDLERAARLDRESEQP